MVKNVGDDGPFCILTMVVVKWTYTNIKIHRTVHQKENKSVLLFILKTHMDAGASLTEFI